MNIELFNIFSQDEEGTVEYRMDTNFPGCDPIACIFLSPVTPFSMNEESRYDSPFAVFIKAQRHAKNNIIELSPDVREARGRVRCEWRATAGRIEPRAGGKALWHAPDRRTAIAQLTVKTDYGFCIQTFRHDV